MTKPRPVFFRGYVRMGGYRYFVSGLGKITYQNGQDGGDIVVIKDLLSCSYEYFRKGDLQIDGVCRMNPTDEYILMCEKAKTHRIDMIAPERLLVAENLANIKEIAFWIPRQDQYWGMVKTLNFVFFYRYGVNAYEVHFCGHRWTGQEIELLLLQVYMMSENDKVWSGKEWTDAARNSERFDVPICLSNKI